jgi:hypothetical protein
MVVLMGHRGSAAVLCLLTAGLLIAAFLMVYDYGMYSLADQQIESGLQASLSSVLSGYDPDVMRELGLFALCRSPELSALGRDYLQLNLQSPCPLLRMTVEDYQLTYDPADSMKRKPVLDRQIQELETYDGWLSFGSDLLAFLAINPLPSGTGAEALNIEEDSDSPKEGYTLWQLLAPWPVQDWTNHRLNCTEPGGTREASVPADLPADQENQEGPPAWMIGTLDEGQILSQYAKDLKIRLTAGLKAGRERLLRSSYIMDQLDYMTAKAERPRYFSRSEAEYVLWGEAFDWDNVRQTAFRLLLFRMALHCAYAFSHNLSVEPSMRLGAAVVKGFVDARTDVEALFRGEKIPAFPGQAKYRISYRDHLRLFLLMQPEETQLSRLQDLLEANLRHWGHRMPPEESVLASFYTKIRAAAVVRITLWPIGSVTLRRQGEMGYDVPFAMVP